MGKPNLAVSQWINWINKHDVCMYMYSYEYVYAFMHVRIYASSVISYSFFAVIFTNVSSHSIDRIIIHVVRYLHNTYI